MDYKSAHHYSTLDSEVTLGPTAEQRAALTRLMWTGVLLLALSLIAVL
ncbi:MAG TPA: hypothetical protein VGM11_13230 [Acidobacteriaceae bacterium]|jgi:hypothetical protein